VAHRNPGAQRSGRRGRGHCGGRTGGRAADVGVAAHHGMDAGGHATRGARGCGGRPGRLSPGAHGVTRLVGGCRGRAPAVSDEQRLAGGPAADRPGVPAEREPAARRGGADDVHGVGQRHGRGAGPAAVRHRERAVRRGVLRGGGAGAAAGGGVRVGPEDRSGRAVHGGTCAVPRRAPAGGARYAGPDRPGVRGPAGRGARGVPGRRPGP
jgi:hypothetical protein